MKPLILFIRGIENEGTVRVISVNQNRITKYRFTGSSGILTYLNHDDIRTYSFIVDPSPQFNLSIPKETQLIFNEISDPDTHHKALLKTEKIVQQFGIPCLNLPASIIETTRDKMALKLQNIEKLHIPLTLRVKPLSPQDIIRRIKESQLEYPVIIRQCGAHGGKTTHRLCHDRDVLECYALPLDGREFYLTQFVDYKDDGIYRKYRLIVIDGKPYIRNLDIAEDWMVHYDECLDYMKKYSNALEQETQYLEDYKTNLEARIYPIIEKIYQRINLDYFGVDCFISKQGEVLIFEVNANMRILEEDDEPKEGLWDQQLSVIHQAIVDMVCSRAKPTHSEDNSESVYC